MNTVILATNILYILTRLFLFTSSFSFFDRHLKSTSRSLEAYKHSFISPPFSFCLSFAKQTQIDVGINTFVTLLTSPCWQSVVLHLKHRQPTAYTVYNHIYRDSLYLPHSLSLCQLTVHHHHLLTVYLSFVYLKSTASLNTFSNVGEATNFAGLLLPTMCYL